MPYKACLEKLSLLPQRCGLGYYSYEDANRQYITPETMSALVEIGTQWMTIHPDIEIGIGDLSSSNGRPLLNAQGHLSHKTHTDGKCVDIRPIRKDRKHQPVIISDHVNYDQAMTAKLIAVVLKNKNVSVVLFNDKSVK
jgi:hypothetical protein